MDCHALLQGIFPTQGSKPPSLVSPVAPAGRIFTAKPPGKLDLNMSKNIQKEEICPGNGNPLQYSCLENPMDGGAWWASVHGVSKSRTRLSDFTFTFHFPALEKEMATLSNVLAWRIPGKGEPGGLPSVGLHRVGFGGRRKAVRDRLALQGGTGDFP